MKATANELYISIDVETNGPVPGLYSMLSLGAAAFVGPTHDLKCVDTFSANFQLLPNAYQMHPETAKFWAKQPIALAATRKDIGEPRARMHAFLDWVNALATEWKAEPVALGYPATFDFMFVQWYCVQYRLASPFGHAALDVKSVAMTALGLPFHKAKTRNFPERWFARACAHSHIAVEDAQRQGEMFAAIMRELHEANCK